MVLQLKNKTKKKAIQMLMKKKFSAMCLQNCVLKRAGVCLVEEGKLGVSLLSGELVPGNAQGTQGEVWRRALAMAKAPL